MSEMKPTSGEQQSPTDFRVDGVRLRPQQEGNIRSVYANGPRLVHLDSFLGDRYELGYANFVYDTATERLEVKLKPQHGYATGDITLQMTLQDLFPQEPSRLGYVQRLLNQEQEVVRVQRPSETGEPITEPNFEMPITTWHAVLEALGISLPEEQENQAL